MRTALVIVLLSAAAAKADDRPAFPSFDIDKFCHGQAAYSFAATLGQADRDSVFAGCADQEREEKAVAQTAWGGASRTVAAECLTLAEGRYGYLARCLDSTPPTR